MLKKLFVGISGLFVVIGIIAGVFVYWAQAFFPDDTAMEKLRSTRPQDLAYLRNVSHERGKILAVVTSVTQMANSGKPTGYELSELARAYWVFTAKGFAVDVASPGGGEPYALLDTDDMAEFDYAFLNDPSAQQKIKNTLKIQQINPEEYQAVYFVGGKGAMFDFPNDPYIRQLITHFFENKKIIAAVCHGPAALVNVRDRQGEWLFANRSITSFTNTEELLLIPDAASIFPFLLQTRLEQLGGNFNATKDYLENVVVEEGLVTGQNPWSVWRLAEETIRQLGYEPVPRKATSEEHSVNLLKIFHDLGLDYAEKMVHNTGHQYNGQLILMHSMVEILKGELGNAAQLIILADSIRMRM